MFTSKNNVDFPAINSNNTFEEAIWNKSDFMNLSFESNKQMEMVAKNSFLAAQIFKEEVYALFAIVYGMKISKDGIRKTTSIFDRSKGIHGTTSFLTSVVEVNKKRFPHTHAVGSCGPPQRVLDIAERFPPLHEFLAEYHEKCLSCQLSINAHRDGLVRRVNVLPGFIGAQHCPLPFPEDGNDIFNICKNSMSSVQMAAETTNLHGIHGSRCHEGDFNFFLIYYFYSIAFTLLHILYFYIYIIYILYILIVIICIQR